MTEQEEIHKLDKDMDKFAENLSNYLYIPSQNFGIITTKEVAEKLGLKKADK